MEEIELSRLFDWVENHKLALPELQRDSVWSNSKVPRLLKSIYERYPFGMMLLWEPEDEERIRCRPFKFQDKTAFETDRLAQHYLIDGQQRLTSLYRVLCARNSKIRLEVAFDLESEEFELPDALRRKEIGAGKSKWRYLHELLRYDSTQWAELHHIYSSAKIESIRDKLANLKPEKIQITYYEIHGRGYRDVTEIFERINLGTPVSRTQIAVGKLSDRYRGIVGELEDYLSEQRKRHGTTFDLELIILAFTAVVTDYPSVDKLDKNYINKRESPATEATIERDWERTKEAIKDAFRFIDKHLRIDTFRYISSERAFICLVYLFANRKNEIDEEKLAYWFAWAQLVQYHNRQEALFRDFQLLRNKTESGVEVKLLETLQKREKWEHELDEWSKDNDPTNRNNIIFKLMYGIIRSKEAVSFRTTSYRIRTEHVGETSEEDIEELPDATSSEDLPHLHEHHIYPKAKLESYEISKEEINDIANLTFILAKDNIAISDEGISYLRGISEKVLEAHLIDPHKRYQSGKEGFHRLIKDRRKLIHAALKEYMSELKTKAEQ